MTAQHAVLVHFFGSHADCGVLIKYEEHCAAAIILEELSICPNYFLVSNVNVDV